MPIPAGWAPPLLSILRIVTALGFALHGTDKLFGWPDFGGSPDALTLPLGLLETIGGGALALGLFVRPVAFVLAGEMAVAYWWPHAPGSVFPALNGGEAAMLYCFVFLYFAAAGGGAWIMDAARSR
jgi:putative oxidoreductase